MAFLIPWSEFEKLYSDLTFLFYSMPAQRTQRKLTYEHFEGEERTLEYNTVYRRANSCPPISSSVPFKIEGPPPSVNRFDPLYKQTHNLLLRHDHNMVRKVDTIEKKLSRFAMRTGGNINSLQNKMHRFDHIEDRQINQMNTLGQMCAAQEMVVTNLQEIMNLMQVSVMMLNHIENGVRELRELVEEDYRSEDHPSEEEAEQDLPRYGGSPIETEESGDEYALSFFDLEQYILSQLLSAFNGGLPEIPVAGPSTERMVRTLTGPGMHTLVEITEDLQPVFRVHTEDPDTGSDGSYHTPQVKPEVIDVDALQPEVIDMDAIPSREASLAPLGSIGNNYVDFKDGVPRRRTSNWYQSEEIPFRCTVPSER